MADVADECVERVRNMLDTYAMARGGETVLVAVSGGPDSMCLWHVLQELGWTTEAAYLDHQTRDGASAADGAFVRGCAELAGVPFHTEAKPVEAEAQSAGLGFEAYARQVRYAFLERVAAERRCAAIATGHTADDQAETVLMRVLRGTTPRGLVGIAPERQGAAAPCPVEGGLRIVRPLLGCTRDQVMAYLETRGVPFRTDESNADTRYLRNRIRHELLPQLRKEFNPRVNEALVRLAETQRCENDLLETLAEAAYRRCVRDDGAVVRKTFAEEHPALQRRIVLLMAWRLGVDCAFERADAATRFIVEGETGHILDLGGGVALRNTRDRTEPVGPDETTDPQEVPLDVPGTTVALGRRFEALCHDGVPADDLAAYCSPARQVFDAAALGTTLTVRHRRPGDRFTPLGMTGSKKLKDHFADLGVPAADRDREILLVANGAIAWVVGHAVAAPVAVTATTQRTIEVRVTDAIE